MVANGPSLEHAQLRSPAGGSLAKRPRSSMMVFWRKVYCVKCVHKRYCGCMNSITSSVTIRALRDGLAEAVGRANYGRERVQITKNGKPAAVLIGPEDFALLEQLEMLRDVADYRAAKLVDAGGRISLNELRAELDA